MKKANKALKPHPLSVFAFTDVETIIFQSFISFIQTILFEIEITTKVPKSVVMSHQNTSRRYNFSSMQQNSFTKETVPLLSILTLPVVENQLENSARNQPHSEYVLLDILVYIIISNISQIFIKNKRKKPSHLLRKH